MITGSVVKALYINMNDLEAFITKQTIDNVYGGLREFSQKGGL